MGMGVGSITAIKPKDENAISVEYVLYPESNGNPEGYSSFRGFGESRSIHVTEIARKRIKDVLQDLADELGLYSVLITNSWSPDNGDKEETLEVNFGVSNWHNFDLKVDNWESKGEKING